MHAKLSNRWATKAKALSGFKGKRYLWVGPRGVAPIYAVLMCGNKTWGHEKLVLGK